MSILTKKVTMTETAWNAVKVMLESQPDRNSDQYGLNYIGVRDAITALAEAETIAVSDTYANPTVDQWRREAEQQGCRCGVCDNS